MHSCKPSNCKSSTVNIYTLDILYNSESMDAFLHTSRSYSIRKRFNCDKQHDLYLKDMTHYL